MQLNKHIILIGFKHSGKSTIGKLLAKKLKIPFIDLDKEIEMLYKCEYGKKMSCRMIMIKHGEIFFRQIEQKILSNIKKYDPSVISLGGGAVLYKKNREIISEYVLIHIESDQEIIYQRIIRTGTPAFVKRKIKMKKILDNLWKKRIPLYKSIANISVKNDKSVFSCLSEIVNKLESNNSYE